MGIRFDFLRILSRFSNFPTHLQRLSAVLGGWENLKRRQKAKKAKRESHFSQPQIGRVTKNVDPLPGSLSTQILP
jgi:hypothetical protein